MSLFQELILRDTRANQPAAASTPPGALYYVTDENVMERNKDDQSAWEDVSAVASGGGGLVLVEKKLITSAVTDVTFSGLDGNTDEVYVLKARINVAVTSTFTVRPNGASTNLTIARLYNGGSDTSSTEWVCTGSIANTEVGWLDITIHAKANPNSVATRRTMNGQSGMTASSAASLIVNLAGVWNETSTNITSLVIHGVVASSIGDGSTFALYKYAQS